MESIYLDFNATTPVDQSVFDAMIPYLSAEFGNPSSAHMQGVRAKKAIDEARKHVAALINAKPEEIIFTSGGTESDNHAIMGTAFAHRDRGRHIIISAIEHPAVTAVCHYLTNHGFTTTIVPVDETGLVEPADIEKAIRADTIIISIMHANNEVGTVQPLADIATIAEKHAVAVHADAAQSVGKIPVDVNDLGVDLLTIAGHKIYAPKGIGALFIREGTVIENFMHGAGHENNRRAGTENVAGIVGLGAACRLAAEHGAETMAHMTKMRNLLATLIYDTVPDVRRNGHPHRCLPNTLSMSFRDVDATALVSELVTADIAVSAGAACHAGETAISPTLTAMMVPLDYARGTIRFSVGKPTTREEIEVAADAVAKSVSRLRAS